MPAWPTLASPARRTGTVVPSLPSMCRTQPLRSHHPFNFVRVPTHVCHVTQRPPKPVRLVSINATIIAMPVMSITRPAVPLLVSALPVLPVLPRIPLVRLPPAHPVSLATTNRTPHLHSV